MKLKVTINMECKTPECTLASKLSSIRILAALILRWTIRGSPDSKHVYMNKSKQANRINDEFDANERGIIV